MTNIDLFTLQYRKSDLLQAREPERAFFLMIMHLMNDIQVLVKQTSFAMNINNGHNIIIQAGSTMAMVNLRLLCGSLSEGGSLLHKTFRKIRGDYELLFSDEERQIVEQLYTYFDNRDNIITKVRNALGYHSDEKLTLSSLDSLQDSVELGDYISPTINNTLYWSASIVNDAALRRITNLEQNASLNLIILLALELVNKFNQLAGAYVRVFAEKYLKAGLSDLENQRETISNIASFHDINLPFFCIMANSTSLVE